MAVSLSIYKVGLLEVCTADSAGHKLVTFISKVLLDDAMMVIELQIHRVFFYFMIIPAKRIETEKTQILMIIYCDFSGCSPTSGEMLALCSPREI